MASALIKLHISIVLAGFTGLFGKWISIGEVPVVWWRLLLVVAVVYPCLKAGGKFCLPPRGRILALFGVGSLQCLHWVLFYASIQASTVSVALVCISLMGFFSAVLSPLILKTRWSPREFLFSGITILGIALIFHFDARHRIGIAIGVVSSLVASLFVVYNKKICVAGSTSLAFFFEMLGGLLFITAASPLFLALFPAGELIPGGRDFLYLFLLAFFCTAILYIIQLQALRVVSAFTVNLSLNLEPIYSIILASLFLGEAKEYTGSFYAGLALITLSVALQTFSVLREGAGETDSFEISCERA